VDVRVVVDAELKVPPVVVGWKAWAEGVESGRAKASAERRLKEMT
jgi:hypothetical protein